ncbi:MAG: hypothetical protein OIF58_05230 [Cohaesibacter sp.]|nr:hypothetical protein [Cohaesibacter sp.]
MNVIQFPSSYSKQEIPESPAERSTIGKIRNLFHKALDAYELRSRTKSNDKFRKQCTIYDTERDFGDILVGDLDLVKAFSRITNGSYEKACPNARYRVKDHSEGVLAGDENAVYKWKIIHDTSKDGSPIKLLHMSLM